MSGTSPRFRFDPPAVRVEPGLRWVLARAFGPPQLSLPEAEGVAAAALANAFGLAPRVASRVASGQLGAELGPVAGEEMRRHRTHAVAQTMRLQAALEAFDQVAAELRIAYAPLKGQALVLGGYAASGSRASVDIDILVASERLEALQNELCRRGFAVSGQGYEHQAPALRYVGGDGGGGGGAIELHRKILGVRPGRVRSAAFGDLDASRLLDGPRPDPRVTGLCLRGDLRMPRREVLIAHALVHALSQHGFAPHAYPGLLLIGDLLDLGFHGSSGRSMLATIAPWIEGAVGFEEADAALALATRLAGGDAELLAESSTERSPSRRLLDHFLAGALEPRYGESLKIRALERPLSDRPPWSARAALVAGALLPSRRRTSAGRDSLLRHVARLIARPFTLFRRWRSAQAAQRGLKR